MTKEQHVEQILRQAEKISANKTKQEIRAIAVFAVYMVISANPHSNPFLPNVESTMEYWYEILDEIKK